MSRKKGFMDLKLAKRLLKEAKETRFCYEIVTNVMGEPLLYKHLFKLLKFAKNIDQKISVVTNGENLNIDISSKLLECSPWMVGVSYHCHDAESFKFKNSKSNNYENYKKNILELIELKYKLKSKTLVGLNIMSTTKMPNEKFKILDNYQDYKTFENEWISLAKKVKKKFNIKWHIPDFLYSGTNMLLPGFWINLKQGYHTWGGNILPSGTKVVPCMKNICLNPFSQFNILWNGDLTLCCIDYNGDLVYDNIRGKSIIEAFNSDRINDIRKNFINKENLHKKCLNCFGDIVNVDGSGFNSDKIFPKFSVSQNCQMFYFQLRRLMWQYPEFNILVRKILAHTGIGNSLQQKHFIKKIKNKHAS